MSFLYLAGGSNSHKSVYMAMQKIFAKNLAIFYSGQGKKKRIPFCSMKIYEAVVSAVRKRHNNVIDESIKKSVSLFLATAKSRLLNKQNALGSEIVLQRTEEEF
ncbi:uncharacterized protein isoform X2 [Leptinotarsa decemlineata]|uniref:uncharacterized protein isoform X2 n=1 Tax=Leptinotarsa decemlineata TaxID=7539 RepID=UPI003D30CD04